MQLSYTLFPDVRVNDREILKVLKALADPTRLAMVRSISEAGELGCGQLIEGTRLSQATVSHHLKILVDAGVIRVRRSGRCAFYSLDEKQAHTFHQAVSAVMPLRR